MYSPTTSPWYCISVPYPTSSAFLVNDVKFPEMRMGSAPQESYLPQNLPHIPPVTTFPADDNELHSAMQAEDFLGTRTSKGPERGGPISVALSMAVLGSPDSIAARRELATDA